MRLRHQLRVRSLQAGNRRRLSAREAGQLAGAEQPWQIPRPDEACLVPVYGRIEHGVDRQGGYNPMWMDWKVLVGVPHDMLISGYGGRTVNLLRLYSARSSHDFDMQIFNDGDYFKAVEQKIASETISKVLYPSDAIVAGQELRLVQEYFLVACALRDIVRRFEQDHGRFQDFPAKVAIQLNDTHPALAVAELMRILVDEKESGVGGGLGDHAGDSRPTPITRCCRKRWRSGRFPCSSRVLPRHLQIIYEINRRFLDRVSVTYPGDVERMRRMSIIEESRRPNRCAWPIWRSSEATRSTGSRRFTPNWSRHPWRRTSFNSCRNGSTTRPTALRNGAGC